MSDTAPTPERQLDFVKHLQRLLVAFLERAGTASNRRVDSTSKARIVFIPTVSWRAECRQGADALLRDLHRGLSVAFGTTSGLWNHQMKATRDARYRTAHASDRHSAGMALNALFCLNFIVWTLLALGNHAHGADQYKGQGWYQDRASGCRFWTAATVKAGTGSYIGQCRDGLADGRGEYEVSSRQGTATYVGDIAEGKATGQGVAVFPDGRRYSGQWNGGVPSGEGTLTFPSGVTFSGSFQLGSPTGEGVFESRGQRYVGGVSGTLEKVFPHGEGTLKMADGTTVTGHWIDGAPEGIAERRLSDGSGYSGEWKKGKPDGMGEITGPDGSRMRGAIRDGKMTGSVLLMFTDGREVDVNFVPGAMPKPNRTTYPDGSYYLGQYDNKLQPHGSGVRTYPDGRRERGEFVSGQLSGQGAIDFADGRRYTGQCKRGHPNGRGVMTMVDGRTIRGEWKDGQEAPANEGLQGDSGPNAIEATREGCRYLEDGSCYRPIHSLPPNIAQLIPPRPTPRPTQQEADAIQATEGHRDSDRRPVPRRKDSGAAKKAQPSNAITTERSEGSFDPASNERGCDHGVRGPLSVDSNGYAWNQASGLEKSNLALGLSSLLGPPATRRLVVECLDTFYEAGMHESGMCQPISEVALGCHVTQYQ